MDIEKELAILGMIIGWIGYGVTDSIFRYFYLLMALRYNFELFRIIVQRKVNEMMNESK